MTVFKTAILTHPGGRPGNEDFAECYQAPGGESCWLVADGLGGHYGGEVASQTAVKSFLASFADNPGPASPDSLGRHLQAAHAAVVEQRRQEPVLDPMRTTFVALVSNGLSACWGHVGDSRLYCFRGGRLAARTKDHSVPQAMADAGEISPEDICHHEDRNRLLRDLGGDKSLRPTMAPPVNLQAGDVFLLCTDGFWESVSETAMEADLAKSASPEQWLRHMHFRVIQNAPKNQDNYTAIAVFIVA